MPSRRAKQAEHDAIPDRFALVLAEMGRLWRSRSARHLKPLGVSVEQWRTLRYLASQRAGVVQKELASAVGVEEPALVGVLDRLVAAGLVERREAHHDRRAKTVHCTPRAKEFLRRADAELHKMREELLAGLSRDELETCIRVFDRIAQRALAAARQEQG